MLNSIDFGHFTPVAEKKIILFFDQSKTQRLRGIQAFIDLPKVQQIYIPTVLCIANYVLLYISLYRQLLCNTN